MAEQDTCGQGLAEHSSLPIKVAELTEAVAENLEAHLTTLDLGDENAKAEHEAYVELAKEHRAIAAVLRGTGEEMSGYRDLPMGRHDPTLRASPRLAQAYEQYVQVEEELAALLEKRLEEDRGRLEAMRRES